MTAAHHALTAQAPRPAIGTPCRMLRLPATRAQAADTIARAEREGLSYAGSLAELPRAECEDRDRRRAERRIRAAHFPREQSLLGNSGTAKSHLLIGLGAAAATAGYRVRYTTAVSLVNSVVSLGLTARDPCGMPPVRGTRRVVDSRTNGGPSGRSCGWRRPSGSRAGTRA
ncbi:ATP-binding protein [Streptomyces sp. NPDC013978]|uniref:ATP-binding protein n=1 Tax=Streptomyces sp. NPDC013978 TaxID=3364869 RepID=UPI0036F778C6